MDIDIKGKQLDIGEALRLHIEDRVRHIAEKYFSEPLDASITMSRDGNDFRSDVVVHIGRGITVHGHFQAAEAYGAFDGSAEHVDKRLRRYKRRLRDHHRNLPSEKLLAQQYVLAAENQSDPEPEVDDSPVVIAEMATEIETMTVSDAVMRMDIENVSAYMFRNAGHGRMNVVYHRNDGHIGWIDPTSPQ
jgi:ribosomal subunit interface protein